MGCDMNKSPVVSISNISKSYMQNSGTSLPVLQNISFKIMNNEIVAIIGHSGCGKTTLLRIICSFEPMDEGVVLLDGIRCIKPCSDILMLFQEFNQLMPWKTVLGNIIHPLLATKFVKSTKDAKELALGRIEDVGLIGFENRALRYFKWVRQNRG
jgi:NitT/TauT family transport system ATP-binding protein